MYNNFFGFKERPFKLVPDPDYLFLSKSHEVALAHLTYALTQGDGFVEITGEIGTGKTTLCRSFLENLDDKTKAAYIFNPKLNSLQLLKAVNDEFGISSTPENTKDLIDILNAFLIEEKSKGTHVVLVIDEAQTLDNDVLEQIRLLSNLETTKQKLLQIVLVGQPELEQRLGSETLRQLGQRITLSSRLFPLSYNEVVRYIQHRIEIASGTPNVQFTRNAYKAIYRYSNGVPRLINMACDRALITAYVLEQKKITGKTAKAAIKELAERGAGKHYRLLNRKSTLAFLSVLCLAALLVTFHPFDLFITKQPPASPERIASLNPGTGQFATTDHTAAAPDATPVAAPVGADEPEALLVPDNGSEPTPFAAKEVVPDMEPVQNLNMLLANMNRLPSRQAALQVAMKLWDADATIDPSHRIIEDDEGFFKRAAAENNLLIRRIYCNFNTLKRLNLPAILSFAHPEVATPVYLSLIKINDHSITLSGGEEEKNTVVHPNVLNLYWLGKAYIPWKNFLPLNGTVPLNYTKENILTLKKLMQEIGFNEIKMNPLYDIDTRKAVEKIQRKYGIQVDGIVGPTTKIALYREKRFDGMPRITE